MEDRKAFARALTLALQVGYGLKLRHSHALECVAAMHDCPDWNTLSALPHKGVMSAEKAREALAEKLLGYGIPAEAVSEVLKAVTRDVLSPQHSAAATVLSQPERELLRGGLLLRAKQRDEELTPEALREAALRLTAFHELTTPANPSSGLGPEMMVYKAVVRSHLEEAGFGPADRIPPASRSTALCAALEWDEGMLGLAERLLQERGQGRERFVFVDTQAVDVGPVGGLASLFGQERSGRLAKRVIDQRLREAQKASEQYVLMPGGKTFPQLVRLEEPEMGHESTASKNRVTGMSPEDIDAFLKAKRR